MAEIYDHDAIVKLQYLENISPQNYAATNSKRSESIILERFKDV